MKIPTVLALALLAAAPAIAQSPLTLWYDKPAVLWTDALPVGNGHMGAMIFGGAAHERIQFNEHTVWTGEPHDYAHKGAAQSLAKIRQLLWDGKQKEAEDLAMKEFMSEPLHQKAYQAFGDLVIEMPEGEVSGYRRWLDLDTGIAAVEFTQDGVTFRREVFASYPANAILVRLSTSKPRALAFPVTLNSAHADSQAVLLPSGELSMAGKVAESAIRFEARLSVAAQAGMLRDVRVGSLAFSGADSATLILTGATNFKNYRDVSADPHARNDATLAALRDKSYETLRAEHIRDHQSLFRRVSLDLGTTPAANSNVRALAPLLFQYGRYLMIGSSRPGGQPANLQGIWNDSNTPAWESKYTDNINTEMNYWPVEETNLSECHLPLFDALQDLAQSGAITAREHYNAG